MAKVLEFQLQHYSLQRNPRADLLQNGLVGSPSSPRDLQESSPTPQFKSINSSALSFLYGPNLTSIHDHWKNLALTRRTSVGKVMSLLFNMLSRLVSTIKSTDCGRHGGSGDTKKLLLFPDFKSSWKAIKMY